MLIELANHNADIQKLLKKGYAVSVDGAHLIVRDIPYLGNERALNIGAIVTKLEFIDGVRVQQQNHQIFFAGASPYGLDGQLIPNLGDQPTPLTLCSADIVVQRSFSNKPEGGFPDFFEKIEHYVRLVSGPAMELHDVSPLTFRCSEDFATHSVFKFQDTLTSRAEITDLSNVFKEDVVAVIGLGGTGAYLLDFLAKTPVKEIRGFDADAYHVHNAFRSPGRLNKEELGKRKAEVYQDRYKNFRNGINLHQEYIDYSSIELLKGVTFAFVCVDKGSARAQIFGLLISLRIPFIDVGMGLSRKQGALSGALRTTYYSVEDASKTLDLQLADMTDDPDNVYHQNIQISELNAMNACMAVIRYKQLRGFYLEDHTACNLLLSVEKLRVFA